MTVCKITVHSRIIFFSDYFNLGILKFGRTKKHEFKTKKKAREKAEKSERNPKTFYELSFALHSWQGEKIPIFYIGDQIMGKTFPTFHFPFFSF